MMEAASPLYHRRIQHTAWVADAALLSARDELGMPVEQLAATVVRYVSTALPRTSPEYTHCSPAASHAFNMLTGQLPQSAPSRRWVRDTSEAPCASTYHPTVTFVSLTASADAFSPMEGGHMLIVLGSKGRFRLLQACKDRCSMAEFAMHPSFAPSWSATEYKEWWDSLLLAEERGGTAQADEMQQLLGVPYEGPLGKSIVVSSDVRLFWR